MSQPQATAPRPRPVPRTVEVVAVSDVSPSYRRVRFVAPELIQADVGAAITIKLLFPNAEPGARPHGRPFTLCGFDALTGEFDVDFVLHDHAGVAVAWARQARPGATLQMFGPRGAGDATPEDARHVVLVGDATALPAIGVIASRLAPYVKADVLVEVPSLADVRPLSSPAALDVEWLVAEPGDPRPLARAVRKLPVDDVDRWWVAAELGVVREVRAHLLEERGVPAARGRATPYWKAGVDEDVFHDERHAEMDRAR